MSIVASSRCCEPRMGEMSLSSTCMPLLTEPGVHVGVVTINIAPLRGCRAERSTPRSESRVT